MFITLMHIGGVMETYNTAHIVSIGMGIERGLSALSLSTGKEEVVSIPREELVKRIKRIDPAD